MNKYVFFIILSMVFGNVEAASIDLNMIFQGKEQEAIEFYYTDKPVFSFFSESEPTTWITQGTLLSSEGHILIAKHLLKDRNKFLISWKDNDGAIYNLNAIVISEHPTENIAILKIDHPYGGKFPQPNFAFKRMKINEWVFVVINELRKEQCLFQAGKVTDLIKLSSNGYECYFGEIGLEYRAGQVGCPVYNSEGETIGIVAGQLNNDLIYFKPFSTIETWLKNFLGSL